MGIMGGMGWECGCRESEWECSESGWKYKKMWRIRVGMQGIKVET